MSKLPGQPRAPIIIAGMHRSGTTLLASMLRELGVFLGWRRDRNEEARTFLEINKWLLLQAGHAWDTPPGDYAYTDPRARALCTGYMRYALNSIWMSFYLGRPWWSNGNEPPRFNYPWGWKDPRNTLTLPFWSELYPDARLILVNRHGVDVAHSLVQRHQRRINKVQSHFGRRQRRYWFNLRRRRFETSCESLERTFLLWQRYQQLGQQGAERYQHCLQIQFEDLLDHSESTLSKIIEFLQLEPTRKQRLSALSLPRPGRAFAYQKDEDLRQFAFKCAEHLSTYGYYP